ncbi:MAG: hypothetical protein WC506_06555 [Candidatus Micrarchaeia archaeon]
MGRNEINESLKDIATLLAKYIITAFVFTALGIILIMLVLGINLQEIREKIMGAYVVNIVAGAVIVLVMAKYEKNRELTWKLAGLTLLIVIFAGLAIGQIIEYKTVQIDYLLGLVSSLVIAFTLLGITKDTNNMNSSAPSSPSEK